MILFSQVIKEKGYEAVLPYLRNLGFREIELSKVPVNSSTFDTILSLTRDLDMHVCCMNVSIKSGAHDPLHVMDDYDELVKYAEAFDCRYFRIGLMPVEMFGKKDEFLHLIDQYNSIGRKLYAEHGIKFYYHHHEVEFQKFDGEYLLDTFLNNTDPECTGVELDSHWLQFGGQDPVKWIKKCKGRADIVHLKDYRIVMPQEGVAGEVTNIRELRKKIVQYAEIGTGNLDMPAIIQACIDTNVKYMPIEQDTSYDLDPFESIRISCENIKKMGFSDCF